MTVRMSRRSVAAEAGVGALLGCAALHRLGRVSGSTNQERAPALPCTIRLPPGCADRIGASLDWVWTFTFDPIGPGQTRMLVRNRGRLNPKWLDLAYLVTIVPADDAMTCGMFRGLQQRARQ